MTPVPQGYDPVTLNHYLWFKNRCHECAAADFQTLFENIMKRAEPQFMQVRPYGSIGDRKCDGLLFGGGTVYQVYSPDEFRQAKLLKKISQDLKGAVRQWQGQMRKWVFVYNVRRGLPPDVPRLLGEKRSQYPGIKIESISSDGLWEIARSLSLQRRAEVLGAPTGYEAFFLTPGCPRTQVSRLLKHGWLVLVQDVLSPINLRSVVDALKPDLPFGGPIHLNPGAATTDFGQMAAYQRQVVESAIANAGQNLPRFAVFSLAPIPLAIHLGFLLSDRVEVRCFQFDRDRRSWSWRPAQAARACPRLRVTGIPADTIRARCQVVVRISLSASVRPEETRLICPSGAIEIDISAQRPDVTWLKTPIQLSTLGARFREVLATVRRIVPGCTTLHLFYAGPAGGAVVLGQQINPRMDPPVVLYQYSRQKTMRHQSVLRLADC
jgi:hypothetical protein